MRFDELLNNRMLTAESRWEQRIWCSLKALAKGLLEVGATSDGEGQMAAESIYRRIPIRLWGDAKFLSLSRPKPNAQSLYFYLMTGPHTRALPGLFTAGEAQLAEALYWPLSAFRRTFQELLDAGMVVVDWQRRTVWLPSAIHDNRPQSPNVVKAWTKSLDEIQDGPLKQRACENIAEYLDGIGEPFREAFQYERRGTFGEASTKAFIKDFAEGFPETSCERPAQGVGEGCGTAFAEQEQKQEQTQEKKATAAAPPSPRVVFNLWKETATNLPIPSRLTCGLARRIKSRLKEKPDLSYWREVFARVNASLFCQGQGKGGWVARLAWVMDPDSEKKILEGQYDNRGKSSDQGVANIPDAEETLEYLRAQRRVSPTCKGGTP